MDKIYIECKNCGFQASTFETEEEEELLQDEEEEQEVCPKCMAPMFEIEDDEIIEEIQVNKRDKKTGLRNFNLDN